MTRLGAETAVPAQARRAGLQRWQTRQAEREQEAGMGDRVRGWTRTLSEEVDGLAGDPADPRTWRMETGGDGWGNGELQCYTHGSENALLDGASNLAIVVRRPEPRLGDDRYGGCGYTSARLTSKD